MDRSTCLLIILLSGCGWGINLKKEKQFTETRKDASNAVASQQTDIYETKPLATVTGSSNVSIQYSGDPLPRESRGSVSEKKASDKAWASMSLYELYDKFSAWVYIILLIACIGFWRLFRAIMDSKEAKAIMGATRAISGVIRGIENQMLNTDPKTPEWSALNLQLKELHDKEKEEKSRLNPKYFNRL